MINDTPCQINSRDAITFRGVKTSLMAGQSIWWEFPFHYHREANLEDWFLGIIEWALSLLLFRTRI
jgi:hypothetical protein